MVLDRHAKNLAESIEADQDVSDEVQDTKEDQTLYYNQAEVLTLTPDQQALLNQIDP